MVATIEGIDVSSNNGQIDWQMVKNAGIVFAFIKATEGDGFVDPDFRSNLAQCRGLGIVPGPYHFYRHDIDPTSQAEHFLNTVGQLRDGDMPPTIDVEGPADGAGPVNYPAAQIVPRIRTFLDQVHRATGQNAIIYTYPNVWKTLLRNTSAFADSNPLWIASYDRQQPTLVGGWTKYTFWQWTDQGSVPGVGHVDRDRFNGKMDDFDYFCRSDPIRRFPSPFDNYILYGEFRKVFEANGDVAAFGNPITNTRPETIDGVAYPYVQWFERARMEWHHDLNRVLLGLVGVEALKAKGREPQANVATSEDFASYYAASGGETIFGLPIDDECAETVDGVDCQVQYFQRARLELNPATGRITLGLVGAEALATIPAVAPMAGRAS